MIRVSGMRKEDEDSQAIKAVKFENRNPKFETQ